MQQDLNGLSDEELARIAGVTLQPAQGRVQPRQAAPQADRGTRNANAGNLKASPWTQRQPGFVGQDAQGFAIFDSPQSGEAAQVNLLRTNYAGMSPTQVVNRYAPVGPENSPESVNNYIAYAARRAGIDPNAPIPDAALPTFAQAMREFETGQTVEDAALIGAADDLEGLSDEELMQLAGIAPQDAPVEVIIDQGVMNVNGRAMIGDRDMGPWSDYWSNRERSNADRAEMLPVLQQERAKAEQYAGLGYGPNFASQTTAPLNDEIGALAGFASQGVENLGRRLMGRDIEVSAMNRGRAVAEIAREQQAAFAKDNPWQAGIGGALGGFAFAPARAGSVAGAINGFARPTLGQAYGQAAAIGGGYGVADAEGGLQNRAMGGVGGAALGLGTAGLIDGGARLIPRGRSPLGGTERRVAGALDREIRSQRMTPQDILTALDNAPEGALPLNVGRGALSDAAEVIAQNPGPGRGIVLDALGAQQKGADARISRNVQEALGGEGNYFATLDNQITQRRQAAKEVIDQIGPQQYRPNENAVGALRSSYARDALQTQASLKANSPDPLIRAQAESLNTAIAALGRDLDPNVVLDVRTAQDVSRALLDASSEAWRNGNNGVGELLGSIGKAVRDDARIQVKPYGEWLKRYGDDSSQIEALELGRSVLRNVDDARPDGVSAEVLRKQVSEMSDTAKEMFTKGVGEAVIARARTSKGGVGAMRDILRSPELADRVRVAFPDEQAFTRFLNNAEFAAGTANTANSIIGNSRTGFRQAASRRMGAQNFDQAANSLGGVTLTGAAMEVGRQGVKAAGRGFARNRSVLENDTLNEMFAKALTDPDLLRQMLNGVRPRRGLFGGRAPAGVAAAVPQTAF